MNSLPTYIRLQLSYTANWLFFASRRSDSYGLSQENSHLNHIANFRISKAGRQ